MLVRLEMDEERMSLASLDTLPPLMAFLGAGTHLAAGFVLGTAYFKGLWWSVRRFAGGGRMTTIIGLTIGRFVLLGGVLIFVSLEGALPLLMTALGVLGARFVIMRGPREIAR